MDYTQKRALNITLTTLRVIMKYTVSSDFGLEENTLFTSNHHQHIIQRQSNFKYEPHLAHPCM